MAEQVRIDIVAEDKASKPLDQVADKVSDLEDAKVEIPVDADTTEAKRDVDALLDKADKLSTDPATLLLTTNATQIAGEIADLIGDLDKLDSTDPEVQVKSEQINSLQGDLDQIETKLRDINDVPVDVDTSKAKAGIDEVGKSASSSKSVLANMIGNTTQDLGTLGGVAGSAGVAFGQMGEYMADAAGEGEGLMSVMSSFAAVAGPIALITATIGVLTGVLADQAAAAKASAERTKQFGQAMNGATDDGAALAKSLADSSDELTKFNANAEGFGNLFVEGLASALKHVPLLGGLIGDAGQNVTDLNKLLDKGGLTLNDFAQSVANGGRVGDDFTHSLLEAGRTGKLTSGEVDKLMQATNKYGIEAQAAKDQQDAINKALIDAHEPLLALSAAYDAAADPTAAYMDLQSRGADMIDAVNKALQDQASALNDQVNAATDAADAQISENKALEAYAKTLKDAKATTEDVRDAAVSLAKAHVATAEAQAKARGETVTATQKLDAQNDALLNTAATAKGKARQAILDYIGSVNQIPPAKLTQILALIDQGKLDQAKTLLNQASGPRDAAIRADADTAAANQELNNTAMPGGKPRTALIDVKARNVNSVGGGVSGGTGGGPRSVEPEPAAPTIGVLNMRLPRGYRGDVLGDARRAARRAGGLYQRSRR